MDNGLLSMVMLGGMDLASLPAHTVLVRTRSGKKVRGIITSRPVHFMTEKEKNAPLDIEGLYIDVGASSREEAEETYGIHIGDPAAPEVDVYKRQRYKCALAFSLSSVRDGDMKKRQLIFRKGGVSE